MQVVQSNISFGMLKKSKLNNFEKVFAQTFKPPLEKMNTRSDLDLWGLDRFNIESSVINENKGIQEKCDLWKTEIIKNIDNNLWKCFIFNAIKRHDIYSPVFNPVIIKKTIDDIMQKLMNKPELFNFMKIYGENLRESSLVKCFPDKSDRNGWVKFSKADCNNDSVIEDIRNLSIGTKWCTKSDLFARECLEVGDFYILFEDGKPKLAIRTQNNKTYEIKNILNKSEYDEFSAQIKDFLNKNPDVQIYRDSVSVWDIF